MLVFFFLPPLSMTLLFLFISLIFHLPALLYILRSKGSQLHDDFPPVAERAVGQGTSSRPFLFGV